jgi:hypothetical protein
MTERYEITIEANDTTEASEKFARIVERDFASLGFPLALIAEGNTYRTARISHIETIPSDEFCHADRDGDCNHKDCPQLRDGEPHKSGRSCPLNWGDDNDAEAWDAPDAGNAALMALARQQHGDEVVAVA